MNNVTPFLLTVAFVAAFFMSVSVNAQPVCVSIGEVTARMLIHVPDASVTAYDDATVEPLLALFNATRPVTDLAADRVIVYSIGRLSDVLAVLFQAGCRIGAVRIPVTAYRFLLRGVTGVTT